MTTIGPQRVDCYAIYTLTLKDSAGAAADLSGVDSIAVDLCPGEGAASVATLSATVLSVSGGTVSLAVDPSAVSALAPGVYTLYITGSASGTPIDFALDYALALVGGVGTNVPGVPTRARLERSVVTRCRTAMTSLGMELTTAGANPDLDDVIGWAATTRDVFPASGFDLTDDDFAVMTGQAFYDLIDLCEYRIAATVVNGWNKSTVQIGMNRVERGNLIGSLSARLAELEKQMRNRFGFGVAALVPGTLPLDLGIARDCRTTTWTRPGWCE